jgi:hypothetical protein
MPHPDLDDYLRLFAAYGDNIRSVHLAPNDARYSLLFEQVLRLLAEDSPFNAALPQPLLETARRYRDGDAGVVRHMRWPENRHFFLSDLYDLLRLRRAAAGRQREAP